MRRLGLLALLVAALVTGAPGRADAHICPIAAVIPVGQLSTVTVAVTVEGTPVPDVVIDVPGALRLDRVDPALGWTIARDDQSLHYRGPAITPYTCKYFSIGVTALAKGAFSVPVTQRDAQGTVVARSTTTGTLNNANPYLEQVVYAGVKPPSPSKPGPSVITIAGVALVGLGVVLVAGLGYRSFRARREDAREDELQDRVDEFKKQARDRSQERQPDP